MNGVTHDRGQAHDRGQVLQSHNKSALKDRLKFKPSRTFNAGLSPQRVELRLSMPDFVEAYVETLDQVRIFTLAS
jgi:hypothetical protein